VFRLGGGRVVSFDTATHPEDAAHPKVVAYRGDLFQVPRKISSNAGQQCWIEGCLSLANATKNRATHASIWATCSSGGIGNWLSSLVLSQFRDAKPTPLRWKLLEGNVSMLLNTRWAEHAGHERKRQRTGDVAWLRDRIAPPGGQDIFFWLLALLVLGDAAFIAVHVVTRYMVWRGLLDSSAASAYSLTTDGAIAEQFNYAKLLVAGVMMAIAWRCSQVPLYVGFAVMFFILLCDDSLQIHETGGAWISRAFGFVPMLGLRAVDFGELIVMGAMGALALVALTAGSLRTPKDQSIFLPYFLGAIGLLVFCGGLIDMAHVAVSSGGSELVRGVRVMVFSILEDGGEMIATSFLCAYAAAAMVWESQHAMPPARVASA
jgi:hypothetical protein